MPRICPFSCWCGGHFFNFCSPRKRVVAKTPFVKTYLPPLDSYVAFDQKNAGVWAQYRFVLLFPQLAQESRNFEVLTIWRRFGGKKNIQALSLVTLTRVWTIQSKKIGHSHAENSLWKLPSSKSQNVCRNMETTVPSQKTLCSSPSYPM